MVSIDTMEEWNQLETAFLIVELCYNVFHSVDKLLAMLRIVENAVQKDKSTEKGIQKWKSVTSAVLPLSSIPKGQEQWGNKDMCSASDTIDRKKRCGEWVGME